MDELTLLEIIKCGEDRFHRFKETIDRSETLAKEMIAFSNSQGGTILIGVTDDGKIKGLNFDDIRKLNLLISTTAEDSVFPPINPKTENLYLKDGIVIVVKIDEGIHKPYKDINDDVYVKNGADKRIVKSTAEFLRLYQEANLLYADTSTIFGSSLADIDLEYFVAYFEKEFGERFEEQSISLIQLLENMKLAEDGKLNHTALLCFGKNPQYKLPTFIVTAISFPGNNIEDVNYIESQNIVGRLVDVFDNTVNFIISNIRHIQKDQGFNSLGKPEIPRDAVKELVANALIHRDYFISATVQVFVFLDRVDINSPGLLPNKLTIENIKMGVSNHRNPTLVSFAYNLLPIRGIGSGIKRALNQYPDIEFDNNQNLNSFRVTIKRKY